MDATATQFDLGLPPPEQLARGDFDIVVRRLADDLAFGSDTSRLLGSGLEYASSRPYEPGDSVRLINWRLSARVGRAFVREYEALKRVTVHLVVDTSASMAVRSGTRSKHDVAVWIAASLGLVAQRRMSPVAVVGAGERTVPMLPSLRRSDLWRAIEPLRTGDYRESTQLSQRLAQLVARTQRAGVIVVISDLHDPGAIGAIRHASQKHDCMVIHTLDPAERAPLRAGFLRAREPETGRSFVAGGRTRLADPARVREELLRSGADALQIETDEPFLPALRHFLATRGGLLRGRG